MSALARTTRLAGGLVLGLLVGCQTYYPYGYPGSYYGTPGPAFTPPGTSTAPGTMSAPGTVVPGGTTYNGPFVAPTNPQAAAPGGNGGEAPAFDSRGTSGGTGGGNLVPEYDDPAGFDGGGSFDAGDDFGGTGGAANGGSFEGGGSFEEPTESFDGQGFEEPGGAYDEPPADSFEGLDEMPADEAEPFGANRPNGSGVRLDGIEEDFGDGAFEEPVRMTPASTSRRLDEGRVETSVRRDRPRPNPYDYDRDGFTWLRGTVDFDPESRTWNLIYALRPDRDDEFGGSITLVGDESLFRGLTTDDVVMVEGAVDRDRIDAFGKASYAVEHLVRLVPKSNR